MGIGCISASAMGTSTNTKVYTAAEEQFIESFEDESVSDVAEFLIDNNFSLSDAQNLVELYIDGKNKRQQTSVTRMANSRSINTFYSGSNLSDNQHYGVVIVSNGSASIRKTILELGYNSDWIGVSSSLSARLLNNAASVSPDVDTANNEVSFDCVIPATTSTNTPSNVFDFPFAVNMSESNAPTGNYTESTLYSNFTFARSYIKLNAGSPDTTFDYETYIQGDINHDGIVDSIDVSFLVEFNMNTITEADLPSDYSDVSANIARLVNKLAADCNRDGEISMADMIWISNISNRDDV